MISSGREGEDWSFSPGSLGTTGYDGHTFWDFETWMFPSLNVLYPELARVGLNYRYNMMDGAKIKA